MTAMRWCVPVGFWLGLLPAATTGCDREPRVCVEQNTTEAPIDPTLMAFLSRARAAHHAADLQENHPDKSLTPLLELVSGPTPGTASQLAVEVREVLADTQARIADLESQLERFDAAYGRIELGLRYVPETSYFRGHLFETEGLVAQRQAALLAKQGKSEQVAVAQARALKSFELAMQIQAQVIQSTPPVSTSTAR